MYEHHPKKPDYSKLGKEMRDRITERARKKLREHPEDVAFAAAGSFLATALVDQLGTDKTLYLLLLAAIISAMPAAYRRFRRYLRSRREGRSEPFLTVEETQFFARIGLVLANILSDFGRALGNNKMRGWGAALATLCLMILGFDIDKLPAVLPLAPPSIAASVKSPASPPLPHGVVKITVNWNAEPWRYPEQASARTTRIKAEITSLFPTIKA